jgi:3-oxoacyl-[acyl-carrier protein] reductase
MLAETVNGALRTLLLAPAVGDLRARQIGVATGAVLILAIAYLSARWLDGRTKPRLLAVGCLWLAMTLAFEFALGRWVLGFPWERLASDYDLPHGGLLPLGLLVLAAAPLIAARVRALPPFHRSRPGPPSHFGKGRRRSWQEQEGHVTEKSLSGRVALVTGASRGIGRAIAPRLAGDGAAVVVNYVGNAAAAAEVAADVERAGGQALAVQADVGIAADVTRLFEQAVERFGKVDVLVNNAGVGRQQPLDRITEADWDDLLRVNLTSVFLMTQAVLPGMRSRRWGRVINLSSVAAQTGGVIGPHYAASKAGMIGLTHSYASLLAKEGVTANAIAPALVETDMVKGFPANAVERIPVGRLGTSEEVADVALMLARNGYVTGQTINVNGGWYMS